MANGALLTIEEYAGLPAQYDDHGNELNDELIEGDLVVSPRASWYHAEITKRVAAALTPLENWGYRVIVEGALPVRGVEQSVLGPDIMVVSKDEWLSQDRMQAYNSITPFLTVEVISLGNRQNDLLRKTERILSLGTLQVWWLRPEQKIAEVHSLSGTALATDTLRIPHLGLDFVLDLAPLFNLKLDVRPAYDSRLEDRVQ